MAARIVELNDKLKAVHLIKALGVDGAYKRDILAKVNFDKEPKQVYQDTKTAIRDICGENKMESSEHQKEDEVMMVKPWEGNQLNKRTTTDESRNSRSKSWDRNRERSRYSRSKSGDRERGLREGREKSYSRDRFRSRDRSESRGRSQRKYPVSFQERNNKEKRDSTPGAAGAGRTHVTLCSKHYDRVFENDVFFRMKTPEMGQLMIVDCGCPRSLMGNKEYEKLKTNFETTSESVDKEERFKFGPSRVYNSQVKVKIPMKLGKVSEEIEFFVVTGNIPILLGNDFMESVEASINIKNKKLELKKLKEEIPMLKTPGGHFVVPLRKVAIGRDVADDTVDLDIPEETSYNIKGDEAEVVMTVLLASLESEVDIETFHTEVGHEIFVKLALEDDEKAQVDKVHRYFGHRSGRRILEICAKAKKFEGKRKVIIDVIQNCKICSQFRKAPPRPKVGIPIANDFNEVVGLDLKVLDKAKGEYILWMVDIFLASS